MVVKISGKDISESGPGNLESGALALAKSLFGKNRAKVEESRVRIIKMCTAAADNDVLVVHSPGGWGCSDIDHLIVWERSLVDGIRDSLDKLGLRFSLVQYYRSGTSFWNHLLLVPEMARYFLSGKIFKAVVMAEELKFIATRMPRLNIVLLGVSQGAAFDNTVMRQVGKGYRIFSIEIGTFFAELERRVITENTLAVDSNGLVPDPVVRRDLKTAIKAYLLAPGSWLKYRLAGERVKFTYCINVPGHDYNWKYPEVREHIISFLKSINE
jgi:hypothetical protein